MARRTRKRDPSSCWSWWEAKRFRLTARQRTLANGWGEWENDRCGAPTYVLQGRHVKIISYALSNAVNRYQLNGMGRLNVFLMITAVALLFGASNSLKAQSMPKPVCETLGRGHLSAVVICPQGLGRDQWRAAGKAACAGLSPCHAWIWDDPKMAPPAPFSRANPMTSAQFESAVALWVDYTRSLYVCGGVYC